MMARPDSFLPPRLQAILDSFNYHRPSPEQVLRISSLRGAFKDAARAVIAATPEGPDQTAALRQLHEAMMTANKSIALEPGTPAEPTLGEPSFSTREFELPALALPPCRVPPAGWTCSRGAGHPGPCAASPGAVDDPRQRSLDDPNPGV